MSELTAEVRRFARSLLSRKFLLTVAAILTAVDQGEGLLAGAIAAIYVLAQGAVDAVEKSTYRPGD